VASVVVGGCGHVGLPLGISLAVSGERTVAFDINASAVDLVNSGQLPFIEPGAREVLVQTLKDGSFSATTKPNCISDANTVIVVIGTPVDEHLNPDPDAVVRAIDECIPYLRNGQLIVLRSTIFPGVTARIERHLRLKGLDVDVVFCPERIAEGHAMTELRTLPQIVGARTPEAFARGSDVFQKLGVECIHTTPEEAELAKLFTNTWRYIKFAIANQFFMMSERAGLNYESIRKAITYNYPRALDLPGAGFAAGPCLLKDTMQLAAFSNNSFHLGHSAMLINEGLPLFLVEQLETEHDLSDKTVGLLGMAFKGDSDDNRSSLSYKLRRILRFRAKEVLAADPFVANDHTLQAHDEVMKRSDIIVIGAPHSEYRSLVTDKPIIDVWNIVGTTRK
jgi:UDP-N-acetyl-D-mannosaminuronic acid dehydrogenase